MLVPAPAHVYLISDIKKELVMEFLADTPPPPLTHGEFHFINFLDELDYYKHFFSSNSNGIVSDPLPQSGK